MKQLTFMGKNVDYWMELHNAARTSGLDKVYDELADLRIANMILTYRIEKLIAKGLVEHESLRRGDI